MDLKRTSLAISTAAVLTLSACGNMNDDANRNNNDGIEQTRFNQTSDYPISEENNRAKQNEMQNRYQNDGGDRDNSFLFDGKTENTRNTSNRNTNENTRNTGNVNQDENNYEVADKAADAITEKIPEVGRAYVLTTDNNAYVAAGWDKDKNNTNNNKEEELSEDVKDKIKDVVKSVNPDIDQVYISTNPDFFNLTDRYVNDVDEGNPVEGLFRRMGNMIERVFPDMER